MQAVAASDMLCYWVDGSADGTLWDRNGAEGSSGTWQNATSQKNNFNKLVKSQELNPVQPGWFYKKAFYLTKFKYMVFLQNVWHTKQANIQFPCWG